jgi:hypothetical protein
MPNHPTTPLASGAINQSGDTIEVVLVQPADNPSVIMIRWPDAPTIAPPARYNEVATTAMRLLADASTMLARLEATPTTLKSRPVREKGATGEVAGRSLISVPLATFLTRPGRLVSQSPTSRSAGTRESWGRARSIRRRAAAHQSRR